MDYDSILDGSFIARDNRFIARVLINGNEKICHVRNTGRCKELLIKGREVFVEPSQNPQRKTQFSLVTVNKDGRLINMDSQAPNKVVEQALKDGWLLGDLDLCRREFKYGNSRFDFYCQKGNDKIFVEVKGVTLEENNVVSFPDAPSERAVKHLEELSMAVDEGYKAFVVFVVQMSGVDYFVPNEKNHKAFADKLREVSEKGVKILAYECDVTKDSITLSQRSVNIKL